MCSIPTRYLHLGVSFILMYKLVADLMRAGVKAGIVARAFLVSQLTLVLMGIAVVALGDVVGGTAA
jgi:hypothetical protein